MTRTRWKTKRSSFSIKSSSSPVAGKKMRLR